MPRPAIRFDLPTPDNETRPFWDGARDGKLLIQQCRACGRYQFYPRPFCKVCWHDDIAWVEASGRGVLYTWSVVHVNDLPPFPDRVPYVAAIVELEEGPRIMTNVVECEFGSLRAGMPLEVTFRPTSDDITLPLFRPAA